MSPIQMEDPSAAPSLATARARSARLEAAFTEDPSGYRVLTGDRPTGPLHLGHYFGTLLNRVRLQDLGVHTIVLVADYQTIIDRDSPSSLRADVEELVADYLAVGIDPERSTIFAHSQVPELNQLLIPFLSLVSVAELARNPTVNRS
jgi:tryptophanyl-tRNA synthetase